MCKRFFRFIVRDELGGVPHGLGLVLFFLLVFVIIGTFKSISGNANSGNGIIKSAVSGYCLDDRNNATASDSIVDTYKCNYTQAQAWNLNGLYIKHDDLCLAVNRQNKVTLNTCNNSASEAWLKYYSGLINPDSGKCLALPDNKTAAQLVVADCANIATPAESWLVDAPFSCTAQTPGEKVSCAAITQWREWNSLGADHNLLLNKYTSDTAYEEWCADFISYVYKQSGFPFSKGEFNGWDENDANKIKDMGFIMHDPNNYTPKPGDIAYFNYEGGHVEIVVSGGARPTFIYGNSAKIDPATGNGNMATNTMTEDGSVGQLMYYLSPKF